MINLSKPPMPTRRPVIKNTVETPLVINIRKEVRPEPMHEMENAFFSELLRENGLEGEELEFCIGYNAFSGVVRD